MMLMHGFMETVGIAGATLAAEMGCTLGAKYGYAFNCTSNFTRPLGNRPRTPIA